MVDLIVIAIIGLCFLLGYMRGGLLPLLGLCALVAAYFGSAVAGPPIGEILATYTHWPTLAVYLCGRIVAAGFIYIALMVLAVILERRVGRTEGGRLQKWNKSLGGLSGLVSGLLLGVIALLLADVLAKVMPESPSAVVRSSRHSILRRFVSPFNPADTFLVTDALRMLRAARDDPSVLERLREHEQVQELLARPELQAVRQDTKLAKAIQDNDIGAILHNQPLQTVLANKELRALILSPEMRLALQDVLRESAQHPPPDDEDEGEDEAEDDSS